MNRVVGGLMILIGLLGCSGNPSMRLSRFERSAMSCGDVIAADPWREGVPEELGIDPEALRAIVARVEADPNANIHSLLVARKGVMVMEQYFAGEDALWGRPLGRVTFDAETLHDLRSVTKSVVGVLIGVALQQGWLRDLDAPLSELLPETTTAAGAAGVDELTLRHLLTMTAGLAWDELSYPYSDTRNDEHAMMISSDPIGYVLERERVAPPGERFAYNGGLPNVLGAILEHATGMPLDELAAKELWCPLGIDRAEWVRHPSGLHVAASGLRLRPRDMARLGQLMLDGGRVGEHALLSPDYVEQSLSPEVSTGGSLADAYGFQWWVEAGRDSDGKAWTLPMAIGNGGQRIVVSRELDLVIVMTAGRYDSPEQGRVPTEVIRAVIAAVQPLGASLERG